MRGWREGRLGLREHGAKGVEGRVVTTGSGVKFSLLYNIPKNVRPQNFFWKV